MLTTHEKNLLRSTIQDFNLSFIEENGIPIVNGNPTPIPTIEELRRMAYNQIYEQGFSLIQQSFENNADCILRVYRKLHYKYGEKKVFNLYGYMCFTKKTKGYKTLSIYGKKEPYSKSKCALKLWITDNEYIDFDCEFKDFCIKIGKM